MLTESISKKRRRGSLERLDDATNYDDGRSLDLLSLRVSYDGGECRSQRALTRSCGALDDGNSCAVGVPVHCQQAEV